MEPIKPYPTATCFSGVYDKGALMEFVPENSSYRKPLEKYQALKCEHHVLDTSDDILPGRAIVAVKWPTGGSSGRATHSVKFYCSVACQRNHAVGLAAKKKRA